MSKIVAFEIINTEDLYAQIFGFEESPSINEIFFAAEFDGSNYIQLLGLIFAVQVGYGLYMIVYRIARELRHRYDIENKYLLKYTSKKTFKVVLIRFYLESCVEISIPCLIALQFVSNS